MSLVVIVSGFPIPDHRAEVAAAFEEAMSRVHEPGVELHRLHEGPDRLVMIEQYKSERHAGNTSPVRLSLTCDRLCPTSSAAVFDVQVGCRTQRETPRPVIVRR